MNNSKTFRSSIRLVLAFFVLGVGLMACSNALQGLPGSNQAATDTKGFPVSVTWNGGGSAATGSSARGLIDDSNVASVSIRVYNATGALIGSGTLANRTTYWGGAISVSETGPAVFEASVLDAGSSFLYVGKATYMVAASNNSLTITAGAAGLLGGAIQGQAPTLSTAVNTFAGTPGTAGTGTAVLPGLFTGPYQITTDGKNLYVADMGANNIRKIVIATQETTTFAGDINGALGGRNDGAVGTATRFNQPRGITTDGTYLYVADYANHAIRRITISSGLVESYAGTLGATAGATENAAADAALFNGPSGITTDGIHLFVADTNNNKIRQIEIAATNGTRTVTTLSGLTGGVGAAGWNDGLATGALFSGPQGITTDGVNVYVADTGNNRIRQIRISDGWTSTLAGSGATGSLDNAIGTSATFYGPTGITTDGTYLYVADSTSNAIRRIAIAEPNDVTTLAGTGTAGSNDGLGTDAAFNGPYGITTDGMNLYVTDYNAHTIRKIQ